MERVFSQVNLLKNKQRNRLCTNTINGILHSKTYLDGKDCYAINISKDLINKINSDMYDFKYNDSDTDIEN